MTEHDAEIAGSLVGVTVLGYSLLEEPRAFVMAVVMDWFVGTAKSISGYIGFQIAQLWEILSDVVLSFGAALAMPFSIAAFWVIDLILSANLLFTTAASAAGPFTPIVVISIWGVIVVAIAWVVRFVLEVIQWI